MEEMQKIFNTKKRIRLGIWGLGRGSSFIDSCKFLNIDVVAGCDYNEVMRKRFLETCPGAFVTDNEDEFLAQDFDAVLVATFFENHARDSIKALKAGKHVMCEVTSFFTPSQGVELVEAVEKSGKVYNLLENYPFQKNSMYVRKLWEEGLFGELMYAEFDYVHECRSLSYTYIDELPVRPGYNAHNWRSWLSPLYYNTHSLGPVMQITGTRPEEVTSINSPLYLDGYLGDENLGCIAPSLIRMNNGGIVRNLMGSTTGDSHTKKLWGRYASVDLTNDIRIRVGASGHGQIFQVNAEWGSLGTLAEKAGHGGGDFWELYYFARQIFTGEKAPWDIYSACDVTLAGIMSYKSSKSGHAEKIPDFRDKAEREQYRSDNFMQTHFDPNNIFPEGHDTSVTKNFSTIMSKLNTFSGIVGTILVRSVFDAMRIEKNFASDSDRVAHLNNVRKLLHDLPGIAENYRAARKLQAAYPDCLAGKAIDRALRAGYEEKVLDEKGTSAMLRKWLETQA